MLQQYSILDGRISRNAEGTIPIDIYSQPTEEEKRHLIEDMLLDEHTLKSSVDPDETPRLEFEENHTAVILKYPKNYSAEDNFFFHVKAMGIFIFADRVIIVTDDNVQLFPPVKLSVKIRTPQDVFLRVLYQTIRHFEGHLRLIDMCSTEIEKEIDETGNNQSLLNLFRIEKGLVYYVNALNGNGRVIERVRSNSAKINLTDENLEFLDDLAIENHQFLDQAQVNSQVMSSLMETRAAFINNNMNLMMKNMNAVVIAVTVPSFFAGVFGMSELTSFTGGKANWYIVYPLFFLLMIGIGFLSFWMIKRWEKK